MASLQVYVKLYESMQEYQEQQKLLYTDDLTEDKEATPRGLSE